MGYGDDLDQASPDNPVRKPGTREPWRLIMETVFQPVFEQSEPMTAQQELDWTRAGQMLYAEAGSRPAASA